MLLADFSNNVNKPSGLTLCTIFVMKTSVNRNTLCVYDKYTGQQYLGAVGTVGGVQTFSGWKKALVDTDISTVMPLSSAAASNAKVLSEKVVYDEFAKKAPLANPTFTGTVIVPDATVSGAAVNKGQMDAAIENGNPFNIGADYGLSGTVAVSGGGDFQIVVYSEDNLETYSVIMHRQGSIDSYSSLFNMSNNVFGRIKIAKNTGVVTLQTTDTLAQPITWTDNTTAILDYRKLSS
jgi:hypothetical protein